MIEFVSTLFGIAALVASLGAPVAGWLILALPEAWLILTLVSLKRRNWPDIPSLVMPNAREMLLRHGHFYHLPLASRSYSASASRLMFFGVLVAGVGCLRGFWWGLGLGVINYIAMALIAPEFDPTRFIDDPMDRLAHDEIIQCVELQQSGVTEHLAEPEPSGTNV